jgi:NADPH-dependent 2,4-dienoyl-CoA reductase/sulfur reductase-like enzyme
VVPCRKAEGKRPTVYTVVRGLCIDSGAYSSQPISAVMSASSLVQSEVDVLVIGAGPAGLMCANGLAKAGINVRIIDKR